MRYLFATLSVIAIAATSSAQGGGARLATCLHGQNETSETGPDYSPRGSSLTIEAP